MNIPEPSDALYLRDGASQLNTLHSNILLNESGQEISLESN